MGAHLLAVAAAGGLVLAALPTIDPEPWAWYARGAEAGAADVRAYGGCWAPGPANLHVTVENTGGGRDWRVVEVRIRTAPDQCYVNLNLVCFFPTPYFLRIEALDGTFALEGPAERCEEFSAVQGAYDGGVLVALNPWSPLRLAPP